jgi:hypothetical protein
MLQLLTDIECINQLRACEMISVAFSTIFAWRSAILDPAAVTADFDHTTNSGF